jgi:proteic killer suppression protein
VIKRFRHKGLERFMLSEDLRGLDPRLIDKLRQMLSRLEDGPLPQALNLPGWKLHQLKGDMAGVWSVWVTGNLRLTFEIEGEDATNVDLIDYH